MNAHTCDAVFENGTFRPLRPQEIDIPEGQRVRLIVEPAATADAILELAAGVYAGLSEEQVHEIEELILSRDGFFEGRVLP